MESAAVTNIPVRLRDIADDLMIGAPPDVLMLDANDLYAYADELDGNSTSRSRSMNNTMATEAIASIIRHVLSIGSGYLVTRGIWTEGDAAGYVSAAALALVALGWSLWQKHTKEEEVVEALAAPAGTSREMLAARK